MYYYFFFSSRRRHTRCALVTGVQTCALPISLPLPFGAAEAAHPQGHVRRLHRRSRPAAPPGGRGGGAVAAAGHAGERALAGVRSEERRVGKECCQYV